MRLLLLDDEDALRRALRRIFERHGFEVVGEASDGAAGVALAHEVMPDIALVDVRMPVMDGIEAARQIKRGLPETVVVMLSAYADESLREEAARAGASAWFVKGGSARELCSSLTALVNQKD